MDETKIELLAVLTGRLRHLVDTLETTLQKSTPPNLVASAHSDALLELARATAECAENDFALHCEAYARLRELRTELDATKVSFGIAETPARPRLVLAWDQDTSDTGIARGGGPKGPCSGGDPQRR